MAESSRPDGQTVESPAEGINSKTKRPLGQAMSLGGDADKLAAYYADWATSYDADVGDEGYGLPNSVLVTLDVAAQHEPWLADRAIKILDAGCGTGRIGQVLADRGYHHIDGIDLSPEMLELADRRGIYRDLEAGVDLTQPVAEARAGQSDLVIVGGVFTVGHIPPDALYPVADLVRPNGVLIVTVRPGYYDTTDFSEVAAQFCTGGRAELIVHLPALPYTEDSDGLYYAWRIS